ncbi:MAG: GntR family transcriptional regulator [Pseudomonadota bacterium]
MAKKIPPVKRRDADLAYDAIETMIITLTLPPGTLVVESELLERTGIGRTPVREALMRLMSSGLLIQQPRRGLLVSPIDLADHLDVIQTRLVLEQLIAACAARRSTAAQRAEILVMVEKMVAAAERDDLSAYTRADHERATVFYAASRNISAVTAVKPLVTQSRRFWYAYQRAGQMREGVVFHQQIANGVASGNEAEAVAGATALMGYLEAFTRRVING